jgi:hypothetical protein
METATRVAVVYSFGSFVLSQIIVRRAQSSVQDPNVLQNNVLHEPEIGPVTPVTLQWPRTASSGRRLTRTTCGGRYGGFAFFSDFDFSFISLSVLTGPG